MFWCISKSNQMPKLKENETLIYKLKHRKFGFVKSNKSKVVRFVEEKLEDGEPSPKGAMFYMDTDSAKVDIKMITTGSYGTFGKFQKTDFTVVPFIMKKVEKEEPETVNSEENE
jgi:hypothetical protein